MLTESEDVRLVIGHELQHFRQGDLVWEILLEALRPLFFWNPAFVLWKRHIDTLRELGCDQQLMLRRPVVATRYADCLLRVCQNAIAGRQPIALPAVPLVPANRQTLETRIRALCAEPVADRSRLSLIFVLPVAAAILLFSVFIPQSGDWSQDRIMLSSIVNLERLDARTAPGSATSGLN